jgi:hypothetical protein
MFMTVPGALEKNRPGFRVGMPNFRKIPKSLFLINDSKLSVKVVVVVAADAVAANFCLETALFRNLGVNLRI